MGFASVVMNRSKTRWTSAGRVAVITGRRLLRRVRCVVSPKVRCHMSDDNRKPDGSAWKAHMEGLTARNDATRKAGRAERAERERSKTINLHDAEQRQTAELRRRSDKRGGSASLKRSTDK